MASLNFEDFLFVKLLTKGSVHSRILLFCSLDLGLQRPRHSSPMPSLQCTASLHSALHTLAALCPMCRGRAEYLFLAMQCPPTLLLDLACVVLVLCCTVSNVQRRAEYLFLAMQCPPSLPPPSWPCLHCSLSNGYYLPTHSSLSLNAKKKTSCKSKFGISNGYNLPSHSFIML